MSDVSARLNKVLGKLFSEHEGERAAAASVLNRICKAEGINPNDLKFGATVTVKPPPGAGSGSGFGTAGMSYDQMKRELDWMEKERKWHQERIKLLDEIRELRQQANKRQYQEWAAGERERIMDHNRRLIKALAEMRQRWAEVRKIMNEKYPPEVPL
jgi:hypothetical protein